MGTNRYKNEIINLKNNKIIPVEFELSKSPGSILSFPKKIRTYTAIINSIIPNTFHFCFILEIVLTLNMEELDSHSETAQHLIIVPNMYLLKKKS